MWKPKEFFTWPSERKKSWKAITRDPNQYYMKYLPPGEEAHEGAWTGMERRRFIICVKVRRGRRFGGAARGVGCVLSELQAHTRSLEWWPW